MKRVALFSALLIIPAAGGLVIAQTATPAAPAKTAAPAATKPGPPSAMVHEHEATAPASHEDGMCGRMMGAGMGAGAGAGMGAMMGGGMNPLMAPGTKIAVKNVDKGVTMTFTSDEAATVARLRKMAEGMRLMHEAMASER